MRHVSEAKTIGTLNRTGIFTVVYFFITKRLLQVAPDVPEV